MKRNSVKIKRYARASMEGYMGILIAGMLMEFGANAMGSWLSAELFRGTDIMNLVLGMVFAFAVTLIVGILSAGLCRLQLHVAREEHVSLQDLIWFFKNQPDRVIIASFVLTVLQTVISIPYYYISIKGPSGSMETPEVDLIWMGDMMIMLVVTGIVYFLLSIPFAMTFYIMADDTEIGGFQALKKSVTMMQGNMGRYLRLQISFVPWLILSMFTFYIALIWIVPYMKMATTAFYRDLRGEFDVTPLLEE